MFIWSLKLFPKKMDNIIIIDLIIILLFNNNPVKRKKLNKNHYQIKIKLKLNVYLKLKIISTKDGSHYYYWFNNNPVLVLRQVRLWTTNCELCKSAAPIDNEIHMCSSSSHLHAITRTEV